MENTAKIELKQELSGYDFVDAEGYVDEELRIDLIILKNSDEVGGIQVKPETYNKMRSGVKHRNISSNAKWGKPVVYLYYNQAGSFTNLNEVVSAIRVL